MSPVNLPIKRMLSGKLLCLQVTCRNRRQFSGNISCILPHSARQVLQALVLEEDKHPRTSRILDNGKPLSAITVVVCLFVLFCFILFFGGCHHWGSLLSDIDRMVRFFFTVSNREIYAAFRVKSTFH